MDRTYRLQPAIHADMAEINRQLDALRALAQKETGQSFRYVDEAPLTYKPWDSREQLVPLVLDGFSRMDCLRRDPGKHLMDADTHAAVTRLWYEIQHQFNNLERAGYLHYEEKPAIKSQMEGIESESAVRSFYEAATPETTLREPSLDAQPAQVRNR